MARKPAKNFEEAILALEESVRRLENGEITLEESIKEYKKGMELAAFCNEILAKAEQEIYVYEQGQYHKIEQGD
ncbi:exodeoxyribonuclease VII small subunit [Cellulosilyticum ruminicola]|uniref:exodeoxyribonuclease VII small subunit n=1 Tax=Cellulosilyticum ruminicola TaxID=425254 RepID=UPI0006CFBDEC|nr:exodeoxyribonuclease VII small subunit [Cellulosilyticum ruminicola]